MSTLTPLDFTDDEKASIQFRLNLADRDIAQIQASDPDINTKFDAVSKFDAANIRIQDAAIAELLTIFHAIVTQRDIDEPSEAPHFIKFSVPTPGDPSFPVDLSSSDLSAADNLSTYLAAVPSYAAPFADATLINAADVTVPNGGWELWRKDPVVPNLPERDPSQPTGGELTAAYSGILTEFDERDLERLDAYVGSYVLTKFISDQIIDNAALVALFTNRKAFWESIGFTAQ